MKRFTPDNPMDVYSPKAQFPKYFPCLCLPSVLPIPTRHIMMRIYTCVSSRLSQGIWQGSLTQMFSSSSFQYITTLAVLFVQQAECRPDNDIHTAKAKATPKYQSSSHRTIARIYSRVITPLGWLLAYLRFRSPNHIVVAVVRHFVIVRK